jgi:hypothetical protein
MDHIFYSTDQLTLEEKTAILTEAHQTCYKWHVDILDCKKSFSRQPIELSFQEIMSKLNEKSHFVIINRKAVPYDGDYLEIGFSSGGDPDYLLWLFLSENHLKKLIQRCNVKMQ